MSVHRMVFLALFVAPSLWAATNIRMDLSEAEVVTPGHKALIIVKRKGIEIYANGHKKVIDPRKPLIVAGGGDEPRRISHRHRHRLHFRLKYRPIRFEERKAQTKIVHRLEVFAPVPESPDLPVYRVPRCVTDARNAARRAANALNRSLQAREARKGQENVVHKRD